MKTTRKNLFETNSSSTHVLTMCTATEFEDWEKGKYLYDTTTDKLVPVDQCRYGNPDRYYTKDQYDKYVDSILDDCCGEYFEDSYNDIKAFGFFYTDY